MEKNKLLIKIDEKILKAQNEIDIINVNLKNEKLDRVSDYNHNRFIKHSKKAISFLCMGTIGIVGLALLLIFFPNLIFAYILGVPSLLAIVASCVYNINSQLIPDKQELKHKLQNNKTKIENDLIKLKALKEKLVATNIEETKKVKTRKITKAVEQVENEEENALIK